MKRQDGNPIDIPHMVTATLRAQGLDTPYVRAGAGPTLVLLQDDGTAVSQRRMLAALSRHFRVVVPYVPALSAGGDGVEWLGGVFDGLGIEAGAILAEPKLAEVALAFAAAEPERVRGVALLAPTGDEEAEEISTAVGCFFRSSPAAPTTR